AEAERTTTRVPRRAARTVDAPLRHPNGAPREMHPTRRHRPRSLRSRPQATTARRSKRRSVTWISWPRMTASRVTVYDVGPRDGLQNEPEILDVDVRAELVRRLADAGVPGIEVASFVDPRRVPQMAGAEQVVAAVGPCPGPIRAGLALNERGYERLVATGLDEVRFAFGVTESFNQRNQGAAVEESIVAARRIASRARGDGLRCSVTLSVAFGCPFEGEVGPDRV